MKISLEWLADFLPGGSDANAFAEALTFGGLPVELIEKHGDDTVMDVEVTSNRGDCLSHAGVARELAALLDREFSPPSANVTEVETTAASRTAVSVEAAELCAYYGARIINNVRIGPSPTWLTRRLKAVGVRAINNVVDCTNYVMFELGQPLHAFDFDRLSGGKIIVRTARTGESLVSLDGHSRKLTPEMLCICDASKAVALAGVMGGMESEVSASTKTVLLEAARFAPLSVRRTARELGMKSDASYRFERGIDPALAPLAAARCAQLIVETAGGEVLRGIAEAGSADPPVKMLSLRLSQLRKVLGIDIDKSAVVNALSRLRLSPQVNGERIDCIVPSYRHDLNIEVDLVEEVARLVGYDKIPLRDTISIQLQPPQRDRRSAEQIRQCLIGCGFFEAVTFSFATDGLAERFAPDGTTPCQADPATRKSDSKLRPSILPGLLEAIRRNEAVGVANARLFEMGSVFWHAADGSIEERRKLSLAAACNYRSMRGAVESVLSSLNSRATIAISADTSAGMAAGSTGRIE